ncbi:50S ribosomal protein L4 [Candidatus Woesearchaeota archaeon]|nr:50S ribosomal protein L4 [Candidatus Woesearchaeota archaeon]
MKIPIITITNSQAGTVDLPPIFQEEVRPDLIKRAVETLQANARQPYGAKPGAGMRYSAKLSRRRRDYKTSYGYGISRVPRKILSRSGTRFNWVGAVAPGTVGGRQAHPPKAQKDL